jgi:6-pyruvoyl tetrahydropterin synthase/QueD family protein
MKMELRKSFQFEAAHLLPELPRKHKCRRLHGHSFKVEIVVTGECDPKLGWVMDYAEITKAFRPLWEEVGSQLSQQNSGFNESHERSGGGLDLAAAESQNCRC